LEQGLVFELVKKAREEQKEVRVLLQGLEKARV
jgi:hypothetical protein